MKNFQLKAARRSAVFAALVGFSLGPPLQCEYEIEANQEVMRGQLRPEDSKAFSELDPPIFDFGSQPVTKPNGP